MLFLIIKQNDLRSLKNMSHNISTNDINIKDPCGNTPMYYAALKSNLLMVVYIWSLGGRINIKC